MTWGAPRWLPAGSLLLPSPRRSAAAALFPFHLRPGLYPARGAPRVAPVPPPLLLASERTPPPPPRNTTLPKPPSQ